MGSTRDVTAIGASAGGVQALQDLVAGRLVRELRLHGKVLSPPDVHGPCSAGSS